MIKNFFILAIRNIYRSKFFSFLNVVGLAIGISASLFVLLWVQDELSYERFNTNRNEIYRVEEDQFYSGERYHITVTPYPAGPVWKARIPEIKEQTRVNFSIPRTLFRQEEKAFFESSVIAADSTFLDMFTFPLLIGDRATALTTPHSIVLTEKTARKYFGKENPIGEYISLENKYQFKVTGVLKSLPKNSMFSFDAVIPFSFLKEIGSSDWDNWRGNSIYTFVRVAKSTDIEAVNKKLTDIVLEHDPQITTRFTLFPLLDIHLHQQTGFGETRGPVIKVSIFGLIALFVLLIACINFINLSTARASTRGKEIGIKKISGADQLTMTVQFMLESMFLVAAAMIFAIILTGLFLPLFNTVSGKNFMLKDLMQFRFLISFLIVGLLVGFVSGVYPAFYLASLKPALVLKGDAFTRGNGRLRQVLVVIQFSLSMLIGIAAVFMYLQLKYMLEKDLGFNKNNLIGIQMANNIWPKYYSLRKELEKETLIQGVTASSWNPVMIGNRSGGASWEGKYPQKNVLIGINAVDYDYLKTLKMKLVSGRDFSRDFSSDMAKDTTGNFLINEEAARVIDIGDPVEKRFRIMGLSGRIVGVMKDFHFKGADHPIEPIVFALTNTSHLRFIIIRLTPGNIPASVKALERIWKEILPEYPLQYSFIDQDYNNLFRSEIRLCSLLKYFTVLAVIIASLGLYGLASYSAERRTIEIGIRKVMGADSMTVIYTLTKEFLVFVIIAIIISVPVGWFIVTKLLRQFAYRIEISPVVFVAISGVTLLIAMLTVSYQAYKATMINPAETLKIE